ncbi:MAG TPA: hypothetical protein PLS98_05260 [Dictyoglomaceae bacterium]|nr:hypothetical protein [Dictyoglomaceae bacterium]
MKKYLILFTVISLIFLTEVSFAVTTSFSFKDLLYDPRAMGMAGAMTALADSPTAAIFNPALMGEYSHLALKLGVGLSPLDETNIQNWQTLSEYIQALGEGEEPPDGEIQSMLSLGGYLNLGISKIGITLFGDGDVNADYYKYSNPSADLTETAVDVSVNLTGDANLNGAVTVAIPAIDILGVKLNIGANLRVNDTVNLGTSVTAYATPLGASIAELTETYNDNNYYRRTYSLIEQRYLAIDAGTYLKFSPFIAVGLVFKNAYATPLEGKITSSIEEGYFDTNGELVTTQSSETVGPFDVTLPQLSTKVGVFVKVPVLNTRLAIDAELDSSFQPIFYRVGIEQPLLMLLGRGGAILDTDFQPVFYTFGAGIDLHIIKVDLGVVFEPEDLTIPVAAAVSGSIGF